MILTTYDPDTDVYPIQQILLKRDMDIALAYDLPNMGYVVRQGNALIAVGFIRLIEGNHGMADSYITDPDIDPTSRNEALHQITKSLLEWAKAQGLRSVMAFSKDPNTIKRAETHGLISLEDHKFQLIRLN